MFSPWLAMVWRLCLTSGRMCCRVYKHSVTGIFQPGRLISEQREARLKQKLGHTNLVELRRRLPGIQVQVTLPGTGCSRSPVAHLRRSWLHIAGCYLPCWLSARSTQRKGKKVDNWTPHDSSGWGQRRWQWGPRSQGEGNKAPGEQEASSFELILLSPAHCFFSCILSLVSLGWLKLPCRCLVSRTSRWKAMFFPSRVKFPSGQWTDLPHWVQESVRWWWEEMAAGRRVARLPPDFVWFYTLLHWSCTQYLFLIVLLLPPLPLSPGGCSPCL